MRASRLVSLLLLLQSRGRMTAQELADELEVSLRTIYRDVESLSAAGVPVYADRGPAGGYQLLDGYRTRLTGLTAEEAESLFLTGLPGPAAQLGLGTVLAAAELKLMAALPRQLAERAGRIRERFHLDAPGWFHDGEPTPYLNTVADAVWKQRRVRMRYRRWKTPTPVTRTVAPLGLVLKAGSWYLVGRSEDDPSDGGRSDDGRSGGGERTYRVDRIIALEMLEEEFERPADFDLAEFWASYLARFRDAMFTGEAVVRFSPAGMRILRHLVTPEVIRAAQRNAGPPDEEGWVRTVIPIESVRHAHTELLKFGAEAEVLQPPELRELVIASARAMLDRYDAART
ncbi:helix-turn-helix transcriptional regulator [Actinoallomurus rhizosphaericola]|uniref:helix-turn-helix transcriptional regulator n=1 Tax=Actinoallomurus rhizosphaericola TaxID=2952536 RepID=UPI002091EB72|nr:YafY family protein [Actinoallomurus rhizosphaericola]MCO5998340.1 YafY family transcriptional regulator [Actinoallomurus rhizosphaericola]